MIPSDFLSYSPGKIKAFLNSVCLILSFALFLKILALVAGHTVLAQNDPVFWFVSSQAVMLAAAIIEVALVGALLSRMALRPKLEVVIWASLVFLLYRIMWSISMPPSAPCPCFGLFCQQIGVSSLIGNAVSFAILLYFGFGSLVALYYTRSTSVSPVPTQDSQTVTGDAAGPASKKTTESFSTRLILFFLSLTLTGISRPSQPPEPRPYSSLKLTAQGRLTISYLLRDRQEHLAFKVLVVGSNIWIRLQGDFQNTDIERQEFYFDGNLGYSLTYYSNDRSGTAVPLPSLPPGMSPAEAKQLLAKKPLNTATLNVRESPVPHDGVSKLLSPWLAFCSSLYLDQWNDGEIGKLFDLERTRRKESLVVPCLLKRSESPPHLPELLVDFSSRRRSYTNEMFRVTAWQKVDDLLLPKKFQFSIFESHREPKGKLLTVTESETTNVDIQPTAFPALTSVLLGHLDVLDERFAHDEVPLPLVTYFITNGVLPSIASMRTNPVYLTQVEIERSRMARKIPAVFYFLFVILISAPLVHTGWRFVKRRNTTPRKGRV